MTKQLFIVYDEQYEFHANLLFRLLSQHKDIKASIYAEKEIKKLVSREKCLYIGQKFAFSDSYNVLGIHIGYIGAKAWIGCCSYEWNVDRLEEFENMLKSLTDKYKLKDIYDWYEKVNRAQINQQFQTGLEPWPGNAIERIRDKNLKNRGSDRVMDIFHAINNGLQFGHGYKLISNLIGYRPAIRWYQYFIGVLKFYEDYLDAFLELSNSSKESNDEETITESEKKN